MRARRRTRGRQGRDQGQGVVEFAVLVPGFMIVLFGMLEFGIAFSHHLTLEYATRAGASVGATLAAGTKAVPCEKVDEYIIAAVQQVVTSPGSQVPVDQVTDIHIYKASPTGGESANVNIWVPGSGGTVDGMALVFQRAPTQNWDPCSRKKFLTASTSPDSIGVSISYEYSAITPLGTLMKVVGAGTLPITDRTVMALQPSQDG